MRTGEKKKEEKNGGRHARASLIHRVRCDTRDAPDETATYASDIYVYNLFRPLYNIRTYYYYYCCARAHCFVVRTPMHINIYIYIGIVCIIIIIRVML